MKFKNGAKRSQKCLAYHTIPPGLIRAAAERATIGLKYGELNYMKGGEDFFNEAKNHLMEHWLCYLENNLKDEKKITDHLKAVIWNAGYLLWYEENKRKNPHI